MHLAIGGLNPLSVGVRKEVQLWERNGTSSQIDAGKSKLPRDSLSKLVRVEGNVA